MKLTMRELQVLILVAKGSCNKKISRVLCISLSTVRKHRQNIYKKLDIRNLAQLTSYAIDSGYIHISDYPLPCSIAVIPTNREQQVMGLVAKGLCNRQIAKNLQVSYSTVRKHRENISMKMGLSNSAELTAFIKLKYSTKDELLG